MAPVARPFPWPNPRPTATFPALATVAGKVTAAFVDGTGEELRAVTRVEGETQAVSVPAGGALTLLARRASDDLELTWNLDARRAIGRIGAEPMVTVMRMAGRKQPYRMTIHRQAATPLLVLASLHGVTLLAEQSK